MTLNEKYDFLNCVLGVSEEALDLAFCVGGFTEETASRILFYYTGYNDFNGYIEDMEGE